MLGPLINPAHPPLALIGVYSPELVMPIAQTLKMLGYQRAAVVHGGGMDEVALHDVTHVAELREGEITRYQLSPEDFGFGFHPKEALAGGTPACTLQRVVEMTAGRFNAVLKGRERLLLLTGFNPNRFVLNNFF